MTYEEFEQIALKLSDGHDYSMCTHDYTDCTTPLRIVYERIYHKMLVGEWVICKECGVVRIVSAMMDVRKLINAPMFNKEEVERIGICVSCTKANCKNRVSKDGEVGVYSAVQTSMVHDYLCYEFTQDGIEKMTMRRGNTCS